MFTRTAELSAESGPADTIANLLLNDPTVSALKESVGLLASLAGFDPDTVMHYGLAVIAALTILGFVTNPTARTSANSQSAPAAPPEPPKPT